jgi:D-alanyl-D-alanine carboxypeptidase/D-alanyl-D-alanine-endopeptidase (penicillin-binding protein 4)
VVTGAPIQGIAPGTVSELAQVSTPVATLAGLTNRPSDNYFAETLIKDLGGYFAGRGSTAAGAAVVRTQLGSMGIHPTVYDGSGLSRLDRTTPRQVARLLVAMNRSPTLHFPFSNSLAVAGRSGTLYSRMRVSVATARCRGKTGTLAGVSALSGYCDTLGGRRLAFSILMNGISVGPAHTLQDAMTATVARDRGAPDRVAIPAARAASARQ